MNNKVCKACKTAIDPKATKCPKCGTDQRGWFRRHPILTFLMVLFLSPFMIMASSKTPQTSMTSSPSPTGYTEEYKTSLGETFCKNRNDGTPYFDIAPIAKDYDGKGDNNAIIYNTTEKPSSDDCKKVAAWCLEAWKKQECENMANKKIWIGMDDLALEIAWGNPNDKNNTTNTYGTSSQWVYGNPIYGANYVYLEGKDKNSMTVTSYQN